MRERLTRFVRSLISFPHYKILAVLVALSAWWYVTASEVTNQRVEIDVTWAPLPPELVPTEPLPNKIWATVEGSRNALRRIQQQRLNGEPLSMTINLAELANEAGDHNINFGAFGIDDLPVTVALEGLEPATWTFTMDEVDERTVAIEPVVVGEPEKGWMVVETRVEPRIVRIRGPRTVLANLVKVDTDPIVITDLKFDRRFETRVRGLPGSVEVLGANLVEVRVDVEAKEESRVYGEVPVYVRAQGAWFTDPRTVRVQVKGPAAALRSIKDRDVVAQVYLPDTPTRLSYDAPFNASAGVRAEVVLANPDVQVVSVQPPIVKVIRR